VDDLSNRQAVLSAIEVLQQMTVQQNSSAKPVKPSDTLSYELGGTQFTIRFSDEESKLNINRLVDAQGKVDQKMRDRVATLFAQFMTNPDSVVDRLIGYMGAGDQHANETGTKNAPFDTIDELLYINGITNEIYFGDPDLGKLGLKDCVTIESSGSININTAPYQVLRAIWLDVEDSVIRAIIRSRSDKPFESITDLLARNLVDHATFNTLREVPIYVAGSRNIAYVDTETGSMKKTYKVVFAGGSRSRVLYMAELRK